MSNSQSNRNCSGTAGENTTCCPPRFAACASAEANLHPTAGSAILQCGEVSNPTITAAFTGILPLAAVEIDTTCLCYPHVKIEFSTLIDFAADGNVTTLTIRLNRSCNGGIKKNLEEYTINQPDLGHNTVPWSFVFCTEDVQSKDCIYSVDLVSVTAADPPNFEFNNTAIAAFAVGGARTC